jgi:excisionase family DNA binding protein
MLPTTQMECLMTVGDVADLLQVPVSWVYDRVRRSARERIPGIKLGKYWRFRRSEVLAWLDARKVL